MVVAAVVTLIASIAMDPMIMTARRAPTQMPLYLMDDASAAIVLAPPVKAMVLRTVLPANLQPFSMRKALDALFVTPHA